MNEVQSIGNELWKNVGIDHHDDADDGRKRDGVPEYKAKDGPFVAYLIGRGRGDANRLRVDHFAHHASGAVGGAHENRAEVELLRSDFLQTAEESIRRSVAAGQGNAKPPDVGTEERK